ncbi:MAG: ATP-binding protein [Planctomycetota bacterium]|jgi:predicted AAA+ superfamily ATPase|nr:ATP-binding protein [Planctomycetota bacterium]
MFARTLASTIGNVSKSFPVLLLTGPRQVGKTTLLAECDHGKRHYVTLDDLDQRQLARTDPSLFLETHKTPLLIDEVQYAPQLFSAIKMRVDKEKRAGQFWLIGSQKFHLMKGITESLAGRVAILDLLGFSEKEKEGLASAQTPFIPTADWLERAAGVAVNLDVGELYRRIWQGSYPMLCSNSDVSRDIFYNSYLQTYIERDVKDILKVTDELSFYNFIRAVAARTGQLLNYADLARDVDIDQKTAKSWLSTLETSGIVKLLAPYHSNITKRIIKTPKLYFLDTGLAAFLTRWNTPQSLAAGAMNGAFFETHVFIEILKSYWHNGKYPNLYYYRDADQKEIDFVIEQNMILHPVEVKKTAAPSLSGVRAFECLRKFKKKVGGGAVICLRQGHIPLSKEVVAVNVGYL